MENRIAYSVALVKCESYEIRTLENSLIKLLSLLGGISEFVKSGERVLVKTNLISGRPPEEAVTTHPRLVEAVVNSVKRAGGLPAIGDSPGERATFTGLSRAYRTAGLEEVSSKTGAPLVRFEDEVMEIENREGHFYKKFTVTKALRDFDKIISIPKLKTHPLTYITAAVKNNLGFIPGLRKTELHLKLPDRRSFSEMLLDLLGAIKIDLAILDGVVAMEGNGPYSGSPRKVGAILASKNPVALDFVASRVVGYENPLEIPTNQIAVERGIFLPGKIEILGEKIEDLQVKDFKRIPQDFSQKVPKFLLKWLKSLVSVRPRIVYEFCDQCYTCLENCPVKCMESRRDGRIFIDYPNCIRCLCCQEFCPRGAIIAKRHWLVSLFTG